MAEMALKLDLPGFRFHPTEEELLDFYLKNIVFGKKMRLDVIGYLNIYRHDPWDLPGIHIHCSLPFNNFSSCYNAVSLIMHAYINVNVVVV
jgi:hypothetical protein